MKLARMIWCFLIIYFHNFFGYRNQFVECVEKLPERIFDTCDVILLLTCSKGEDQIPKFFSGQEVFGMRTWKLCCAWRERHTKYETKGMNHIFHSCLVLYKIITKTEIFNYELSAKEIEEVIQTKTDNDLKFINDVKNSGSEYIKLLHQADNSELTKIQNIDNRKYIKELFGVKLKKKQVFNSESPERNDQKDFWRKRGETTISHTFDTSKNPTRKITVKKKYVGFEVITGEGSEVITGEITSGDNDQCTIIRSQQSRIIIPFIQNEANYITGNKDDDYRDTFEKLIKDDTSRNFNFVSYDTSSFSSFERNTNDKRETIETKTDSNILTTTKIEESKYIYEVLTVGDTSESKINEIRVTESFLISDRDISAEEEDAGTRKLVNTIKISHETSDVLPAHQANQNNINTVYNTKSRTPSEIYANNVAEYTRKKKSINTVDNTDELHYVSEVLGVKDNKNNIDAVFDTSGVSSPLNMEINISNPSRTKDDFPNVTNDGELSLISEFLGVSNNSHNDTNVFHDSKSVSTLEIDNSDTKNVTKKEENINTVDSVYELSQTYQILPADENGKSNSNTIGDSGSIVHLEIDINRENIRRRKSINAKDLDGNSVIDDNNKNDTNKINEASSISYSEKYTKNQTEHNGTKKNSDTVANTDDSDYLSRLLTTDANSQNNVGKADDTNSLSTSEIHAGDLIEDATTMDDIIRTSVEDLDYIFNFTDKKQNNTNVTGDTSIVSGIKYTPEITDSRKNITTTIEESNHNTTWAETTELIVTEKTTKLEGNTSLSPMTVIDSCAKQCNEHDPYGHIWTGCPGILVTQNCPFDAYGQASWQCDSKGKTFVGDMPNYSNCTHIWIFQLFYYIWKDDDALWIASEIDKRANYTSFFGHELEDLLQLLYFTFDLHLRQLWYWYRNETAHIRLQKSTNFTELTTAVLDKLLQSRIGMLQLKEAQRVTIGMLLTNLSIKVGFALASHAAAVGQHFKYNATFNSSQSVVFGVDVLGVNSSNSHLVFPSPDGDTRDTALNSHISVHFGSAGHFKRPRSVGMILDSDPASLLFPPSRNRVSGTDSRCTILNSDVISFTLQGVLNNSAGKAEEFTDHSAGIKDTVRVFLKHVMVAKGPEDGIVRRDLYPGEEVSAVLGSARCVYWNVNVGEGGLWDETGCRVEYSDRTHTLCICSHLSTFAVLMDIHDYVGKDSTLEVLSWACTGTSVLCLLLTLIVFQQCRSIQSERTRIGKNLCVCLVMAHLVALLFLDRSYVNFSEVACSLIACFLHYLFLASFCWMTVEGHHLYRMILRVFDSGRDYKRWYLLVGYGFPAIVVLVTKIVALARKERAYGRDELCWLSSPLYIWSFIGPVLLLTTINTTVLMLALREAVFAGLSQGKSKRETVWIWIRGWFSLSALLGITWVFGLAYMEFNHSFVYIFVVLNGCQGVFIFLFRCVLSEQVRNSVVSRVKRDGIVVLIKEFYYLRSSLRSDGSNNASTTATGQFECVQEEGDTAVWHVVTTSTKEPVNDGLLQIQIQGAASNEGSDNMGWSMPPNNSAVQVRDKQTINVANAEADTSFFRGGNWRADESVSSEACRPVRHVSVTRYPTIEEESDPDC